MGLFKAELLKLKKMSIFQCAVLIPLIAFLSSIGFYNFIKASQKITVWQGLGITSSIIFIGMLLPMLLIYVIVMMGKIENLNNGWKQLLVMPIKREKIYLTKYLVILLVFGITLISYLLQYVIVAYFLGAKGMIPVEIIINVIYVFICFQPFIAIIFFLSNRFNSVVLSLGVGMMFVLSSLLIVQSDYWRYAPWTYALILSQGGSSTAAEIIPLISISLVIFSIILSFDIINFRRKDII